MNLKKIAISVVLVLAMVSATSVIADGEPLPIRTDSAIVYATPFNNMVILDFKLYDNKTWCFLYVKKDAWEAAKANGGKIPDSFDPGQLQCRKR